MNKLQDKVAIVTGGGQGVGLGIAQALAEQGARLVITGRHDDKLQLAAKDLRTRGAPDVLAVVSDVRKRESARETVRATVQKFGQLDVLVNNAQSSSPGTPFENINDETFELTIESGLFGTLYHMQESFPHLKARGGSIINLGSREGIFGGIGMSVYAATKEGIRGLSRSVAREWGKYNIRVNVICPAALSPSATKYLESHPEEAKMYLGQTSLGRFGDPYRDIGLVAAFLASPDAAYLTGQTLNADGGQMML